MNADLTGVAKELPRCRLIFFWLIVIAMLFIAARYNYLLFHSIIEVFSIVVGVTIYLLAARTYEYSGCDYLQFIGIVYLSTSIITFFHLVTYHGMGVIPSANANTSTQLWIAGRYVESFSLLVAPIVADRKYFVSWIKWIYMVLTITVLGAVMWLKIFPICYINDVGLTSFKIISEYITCLFNGITIIYLQYRKPCYRSLYGIMSVAMIFSIVSGISLTMYVDPYGILNFTGHVLRAVALYTIFEGVVLRGLEDPYYVIFQELRFTMLIDQMTGLYNRQGLLEITKKAMEAAKKTGARLGFLLIDLDKFKTVNDNYGHIIGDKVLIKFSHLLKSSLGSENRAFRVGGDEFMAMIHGDQKRVEEVCSLIRKSVEEWTKSDSRVREMGVSIGWTLWKPGDSEDVDFIIKEADCKMYLEKTTKKSTRK